jgi:putative acetyltransferase
LGLNIIIRNETESDFDATTEVTEKAFETLEISNHTEQFIVKALRELHALTVSLVAEVNGKVVGHIAFSPVTISDGSQDWYGLGPVSVLPEFQGEGIGKSLINKGLSTLQALGAMGCVLAGDPGYYNRFGFKSPSNMVVEGVPQQYFLAISFGENEPRGAVVFHESFNAKS